MPQVRRPVTRGVSFTEDEFDYLRRAARIARKPFARYVRETAMGARVVIPPSRVDRALVNDLGRVGNNLNQLAREANAARAFPAEAKLEAALAELRAALTAVVAAYQGRPAPTRPDAPGDGAPVDGGVAP